MLHRYLFLALIGFALFGCSTRDEVTLEFRLAEDEAAPGLTEIVFNPTGVSFYLHDEVWIDESDVDSAFVTMQNGKPAVEILLTSAASDKWAEFTERNVGKRCGMILNGKLVSAPRIMAPIRVGRAIIAGDFTESKAKRIALAFGQR